MAKATKASGFVLPRKDLLAALESVAPAIAAKSVLETLMHVWFDGETLMAYNDSSLGIEVPFKAPFKGGIRGALLLGLLNNSVGDNVEFIEQSKDDKGRTDMLLKVNNTKLNLTMLDIKEAPWTFPESEGWAKLKFGNDLILMLEKVMLSCGQDTSVPDQLGVTFILDGKELNLFTTDSRTISWMLGAAPAGYKIKRVVLPTPFCEHIRKVCKKGGDIFVSENEVQAINDEGCRVFARVVDVVKPTKFFDLTDSLPAKDMPFPDGFQKAIDRAVMLLETQPGEPIEVEADGDFLYMNAKSPFGELNEKLELKGHPKVSVMVDPVFLKRGLPLCTDISISNEMVVMSQGKFVYVTSTRVAD